MQKYPVVVNQNNESETIQDLVPNTRLGLSDQSSLHHWLIVQVLQ